MNTNNGSRTIATYILNSLILISVISLFLVTDFFGVRDLGNLPKIDQSQFATIGEEQGIQPEIKVSFGIDFGEGNVKNFSDIQLKENETVFDLLKKLNEEGKLEFSFKDYPGAGVFIESIDGVSNDPKTNLWWQYLVNGQYAQVGASNYQLKDGDSIEWKYVESQLK